MILVACYGDEALLKSLGFKDIFHNFGSGEVGNQLIRSNNKIAMIDADPTKTKHNIPSTRENLHEYLAKRTISKVFETFLKEVIVRNAPHFVYIKSLLEELEGLVQ